MNQMSEKRLTEARFNEVVASLAMEARSVEMAKFVLVDGEKQSDVAAARGLTKGAVSQIVSKVWEASQVPPGYVRVTAVLPEHQAYQVEQWAAKAAAR